MEMYGHCRPSIVTGTVWAALSAAIYLAAVLFDGIVCRIAHVDQISLQVAITGTGWWKKSFQTPKSFVGFCGTRRVRTCDGTGW